MASLVGCILSRSYSTFLLQSLSSTTASDDAFFYAGTNKPIFSIAIIHISQRRDKQIPISVCLSLTSMLAIIVELVSITKTTNLAL